MDVTLPAQLGRLWKLGSFAILYSVHLCFTAQNNLTSPFSLPTTTTITGRSDTLFRCSIGLLQSLEITRHPAWTQRHCLSDSMIRIHEESESDLSGFLLPVIEITQSSFPWIFLYTLRFGEMGFWDNFTSFKTLVPTKC